MNKTSKIKLMIVDDGTQMTTLINNHFLNSNAFDTIISPANADEIIKLVKENTPDILICDVVMPGRDGFAVIEEIHSSNEIMFKPKIIVLSALSGEIFISKAISLGASYYILKPFDINTLFERTLEIYSQKSKSVFSTTNLNEDTTAHMPVKPNRNKVIDEKISNIFITVGIPAHIKGYQFLREAIKMAIDQPEIINSITKQLYPNIAFKFSTSASKVERAIRHAIEVAWNRGRIENINSLFGVKVYGANDKPTNGEFIALVADKMLIEGA